ncbi:MAG TPA: hypothetical protein VIU61_09955 [Kofleriaceae bacterium]
MRWLASLVVLVACGGDDGDILDELAALPNVRVSEWTQPQGFEPEPGYRYFDLWFTQPVDHENPAAGTFEQYAALMHRDAGAPLVLHTSGYGAGWKRYRNEPTTLVEGNQLSLEYRYYADSRPETIDWSTLTVQQNAADEHAVLETIGEIYRGPTLQTGGSKGGETAMFHMMLYPDDLDGAIAYVAPVITDLPDTRYATVLDDIGAGEPAIDACRDRLRAVQRELLVRRTAIEALTALEEVPRYEIAGLDHAVESAIVELEFVFWMTRGETDCDQIPPTTAPDAELYTFLVDTNSPVAFSDAVLLTSGNQYIYQDMRELGYPVLAHAHLDDLTRYSYEDWTAYLPTALPVYDPTISRQLDAYLRAGPQRILHVGGAWDPWGAGYPTIGDGAFDFSVARGTHWSSGIYSLPDAEKSIAADTVRAWAGAGSSALRGPTVVPKPLASMASPGPI